MRRYGLDIVVGSFWLALNWINQDPCAGVDNLQHDKMKALALGCVFDFPFFPDEEARFLAAAQLRETTELMRE